MVQLSRRLLVVPVFTATRLPGIVNLELYPNNIVKVYNRWGSLVFEAEPYQNDWNGHYKGTAANSLPASTYFYVIDTKKKSQDPYTGYIEIQP